LVAGTRYTANFVLSTKFGTDQQSVQSEAGKVSCNKTAL